MAESDRVRELQRKLKSGHDAAIQEARAFLAAPYDPEQLQQLELTIKMSDYLVRHANSYREQAKAAGDATSQSEMLAALYMLQLTCKLANIAMFASKLVSPDGALSKFLQRTEKVRDVVEVGIDFATTEGGAAGKADSVVDLGLSWSGDLKGPKAVRTLKRLLAIVEKVKGSVSAQQDVSKESSFQNELKALLAHLGTLTVSITALVNKFGGPSIASAKFAEQFDDVLGAVEDAIDAFEAACNAIEAFAEARKTRDLEGINKCFAWRFEGVSTRSMSLAGLTNAQIKNLSNASEATALRRSLQDRMFNDARMRQRAAQDQLGRVERLDDDLSRAIERIRNGFGQDARFTDKDFSAALIADQERRMLRSQRSSVVVNLRAFRVG